MNTFAPITAHKSVVFNQTVKVVTHIAREEFDAKGRQLGQRVTTWEADLVAEPENNQSYFIRLAPGHYWMAHVQQLKDGKSWGASQREHFFDTEAERDAYVAKRTK